MRSRINGEECFLFPSKNSQGLLRWKGSGVQSIRDPENPSPITLRIEISNSSSQFFPSDWLRFRWSEREERNRLTKQGWKDTRGEEGTIGCKNLGKIDTLMISIIKVKVNVILVDRVRRFYTSTNEGRYCAFNSNSLEKLH